MKYSMSRFLFLLFVWGFACCISKGTIAAMDGEEEGNSYGGNDSYNNGGGYPNNNGNNGMMMNGGSMMGNGGNMRSQVRSIVDNILHLNQRGGQFYNNNNGPYNNGGYGNNNYAQYGDGSNGYQQNGNESSYQSQQQWNNGQYNGDGDQYNNGGNYQNNNGQSRNNEAIALADNREVNQRIEKAINELNTLKKNVNQRFSQIQQKNGHNKNQKNHNAEDKKTEKNSNKNMLAGKQRGTSSKQWKHRNKAKCNKQIFTVKNIDTCNMRTNSYLSTKNKYGLKYYAKNDNYRDYTIKSYSPKNSHSFAKESTKAGHITYKIKSYSKNADGKTNTELAALDNKKYTVKDFSYFAHKDGCPENKCG